MAFLAPALPFIAAGATIAGTAIAAKGQADAGAAAQSAYNANARALQVKAQTDQDAAEAEARMVETANERRYGTIRTNYGASGVDPNTGSALDVMADQHAQGALQAALQRYQGKVAALQDTQQADIDIMQGKAAKRAGNTAAIGTVLTGVGRAAATPGLIPAPTGG